MPALCNRVSVRGIILKMFVYSGEQIWSVSRQINGKSTTGVKRGGGDGEFSGKWIESHQINGGEKKEF